MSSLRILIALILALTAQVLLARISPQAPFYVNPLTLVVVFAAIRGSPTAGMLSGSVAGLFQDAFSSQVIGVSSFCKALIGYLLGILSIKLVVRSVIFLAPLIFLASATEMLLAALLDRVIQVRPVLTGSPILTVAIGNALLGTAIIKLTERLPETRR